MSTVHDPACLRGESPGWCVHAVVARRVTRRILRGIHVRVDFADGTVMGGGADDPAAPVIEVVRPEAFFRRVGHQPKIGFGEAYMAGDWRPKAGTDLGVSLYPFADRIATAVPPALRRARLLVERRVPQSQRNTPSGSRANIEAHYDLSNELFTAFLDPSLSYSSAMFDRSRPLDEQTLEDAQLRKVDSALDRAGVGEGTRLLEIGTGWGTLAIRAAQRGASVTSLTLSTEQASLARTRANEAGVASQVDIVLQDYREATGTYDAVVSIEMIEAVGEEFWTVYFETIDRLLAPGGVAVVQSILMSHDRYLSTRRSFSWIQKHIFPGGIIPSVEAIEETTQRRTSLRVTEAHHFGADYAETLRRWRATFLAAWPTIARQGFDEQFRRMWEFYLSYSESGFETGYLDVAQFRFEREDG